MFLRTFLTVAAFALVISATNLLHAEQKTRVGIVPQRPKSGPIIQTDAGYMVPYQHRIPGTDVAFQMIPIPGGRYTVRNQASENDGNDAQSDAVTLSIEPFWMGKYEVTWQEFRAYMNLKEATLRVLRKQRLPDRKAAAVDAVTAPSVVYDISFAHDGGDGADTPAVTMTHFAAKQYTKWLSLLLNDFYRLPSEAEWEYACSAGAATVYAFGNDSRKLANYGWYEANSDLQRHPVGSKLPNRWGLYDMHGNVAEWVLDATNHRHYASLKNGTSSIDAIRWPDQLHPRVAKGGSWEQKAVDCRSDSRLKSTQRWSDEDPQIPRSPWWHTSYASTGVGIRLLRPLSVPETAERKEQYWKADIEDLQATVEERIDIGYGLLGTVDPDQPQILRPTSVKER